MSPRQEHGDIIPSISSIDSDFIDLAGVFAKILDVSQDMPPTILANKVSQVSSQTHVCHSRLVVSPFLDRESLEEDESLSIEKVFAQCMQGGR